MLGRGAPVATVQDATNARRIASHRNRGDGIMSVVSDHRDAKGWLSRVTTLSPGAGRGAASADFNPANDSSPGLY